MTNIFYSFMFWTFPPRLWSAHLEQDTRLTLWQDAFKILIPFQILKIQIILLRGNFNNFRLKNGWKCHKTHNRLLPWQQMSKRFNLFILFMCTQRTFTSQVISKIYFLTFASYIEKLPETIIKIHDIIQLFRPMPTYFFSEIQVRAVTYFSTRKRVLGINALVLSWMETQPCMPHGKKRLRKIVFTTRTTDFLIGHLLGSEAKLPRHSSPSSWVKLNTWVKYKS